MKKMISAEEFDRMFDEGDMRYLEYVDLENTRRPGLEPEKIAISLPNWMVRLLDREAKRIGITRQALIKTWLDEKLSNIKEQQYNDILLLLFCARMRASGG
ncbi:MAG: BrnA antitoxin family protein [Coriobacteriales bacterium]|jgi:hypothetical protein|nr:BrnA antitoxin family protein [Coriobacteriales bacterium]